eukprot:CAMPEP_0174715082 /NCGR_PEP_ID=MMETSP1094-20130205/20185_1 /TAXON_ID=156173 /ORGANISM="Chrysochromulina brevifilum, Strain UTEX LB 985" /LENGTH=119 /DNA_ID=CAMNT_0015914597 /DNA_START=269 /DNA_END=630 /DNA_ORIENTATION=+
MIRQQIVGVGIPEAAASHPDALSPLFADDHLHYEFVARQLELLFYAALDAVGNLARPLRCQLLIIRFVGEELGQEGANDLLHLSGRKLLLERRADGVEAGAPDMSGLEGFAPLICAPGQ